MKILLITYGIDLTSRQSSEFYTILKSASAWWHYLPSAWLIQTTETPHDWFKKLAPIMNKSDRLLIVEIKNNYFGWLPKEAWDWIEKAFKT